MIIKRFGLLLLLIFFNIQSLQKTVYSFSNQNIDVVIPCHEKDKHSIEQVISSLIKYVKDIRNIIIISKEKFSNNAQWFSEDMFPFSKETIAFEIFADQGDVETFLNSSKTRINWIYQQLLKLYAPFIIPDISNNVLVFDADTILLKPIEFRDTNGAALFNVQGEYHDTYFVHGRKVCDLRRVFPQFSGVTHHMLFQKCVLEDMFSFISEKYNGEKVWKVLSRCIDVDQVYGSCMSEYELYFNFCFMRSNQFKIRLLNYKDIEKEDFEGFAATGSYHYLSCHIR